MSGGTASSGAGIVTSVGSRAMGTLGPIGAVAGAGLGGYELGTLIYPIVEPGLSRVIDYVCRENPDEEFCRKRKQYCITYELGMPGRKDNFGPFRACIRRCMNAAGCNDY
jgi:hypothetical protein